MSGGVCPPCLSYSLLKSATLSEELWDKSQSRHQPIDQNERSAYVCVYMCVFSILVKANAMSSRETVGEENPLWRTLFPHIPQHAVPAETL